MEDHGAQNTTRANHHHHPYNGREDCWSEGATETLIKAWGDRYLQLNRGNLRQKDWNEVADAVNGRQNGVKPRKTDVQCKYRIDTLKKKYKLEKSKPPPSKWTFYSNLDQLIGISTPAANKKITPTAVTVNVKKEKSNFIRNPNAVVYSGGSSSKSRINSLGSSGSSHGGGDDVALDDGARKDRTVEDSSDGVVFRELARAIVKFGEIYERIESSKQKQMMELERQRMEFTKDLEFQRTQMFMEAQIELEKMKRPKYGSSTGAGMKGSGKWNYYNHLKMVASCMDYEICLGFFYYIGLIPYD